jgi:hypothetical protein
MVRNSKLRIDVEASGSGVIRTISFCVVGDSVDLFPFVGKLRRALAGPFVKSVHISSTVITVVAGGFNSGAQLDQFVAAVNRTIVECLGYPSHKVDIVLSAELKKFVSELQQQERDKPNDSNRIKPFRPNLRGL